MTIKIIPKENISDEYQNHKMSFENYLEQVETDGVLSKEKLKDAKNLVHCIANIRKIKAIDSNFIEMFKQDDVDNTNNLSHLMGMDIGGFDINGLKVVATNVEMGVGLKLNEPKSQDIEEYLKVAEMFYVGLYDNKQYQKMFKSLNTTEKNNENGLEQVSKKSMSAKF